MSKGTGPRNKQRAYEHEIEIRDTFREAGLKSERAFASRGTARGWDEETDVMVWDSNDSEVRVQAKRRKRIADYLTPNDGSDIVVVREDYGKNYAVVPLEMYIELLRRKK